MRRIFVGMLVLWLAAACGSSGSSAGSPAASAAPAASTAAAAPTAAPATAKPATTAPTLPFEDAKLTGTWNNLTFGSSGPASFDIKVDRTALTMTVTVTLGGNVFGAPAPAPESFTLPISASGATYSGTSKTFGTVTATLKDGTFTFKGDNVPGGRVKSIDGSGTYTASSFTMSYNVALADGSTAKGTVTLKKA